MTESWQKNLKSQKTNPRDSCIRAWETAQWVRVLGVKHETLGLNQQPNNILDSAIIVCNPGAV